MPTTASSSLAEAASRPNGFSITTGRASSVRLRESPASPSFVVTSGKTVGGVAR